MNSLVTAKSFAQSPSLKTDADIQKDLEFYSEYVLGRSAENTKRAFHQSVATYNDFLKHRSIKKLPLHRHEMRQHVLEYLEHLIARGDSRSTIGLRLWAMNELHSKAGLQFNDTDLSRAINARINIAQPMHQSKQAKPLSPEMLERINMAPHYDPAAIRNKALVNIAFDTLGRASEVAELRWSDIQQNTITIRKSKTDQEGKGRVAYLSETTLSLLSDVIETKPPESDFIFRPLKNQYKYDSNYCSLTPLKYIPILKGLRSAVKLAGELPEEYSFHSTRVGAAVAMREAGIPIIEILHAGGWKSEAMVLRYTKAIDAQKSGSHTLAKHLGR